MNYKINVPLIETRMLEKGYSLTKLASIAHTSTSTVARIINQQGTPRPQTIYKIAQALELEPTEILL
ncbi:MAG: helix-turn-helix domain-containing protein [Peptostreptococcaceae bacterium]